jgi:AcrR family transcriptional regulator
VKDAFREELERLLEAQAEPVDEPRAQLEAGVLLASAEVGYPNLTVQKLLKRTGLSRSRFYREFSNLDDCFALAYSKEIDRFVSRLLGGPAGDWRTGLRKGLDELESLVLEQPVLARGLLIEARIANGSARTKKREVCERLSRALDEARRETTGSRHSPPPLTAPFMLSAFEAAVENFLVRHKGHGDFAQVVRSLENLTVEAYFG